MLVLPLNFGAIPLILDLGLFFPNLTRNYPHKTSDPWNFCVKFGCVWVSMLCAVTQQYTQPQIYARQWSFALFLVWFSFELMDFALYFLCDERFASKKFPKCLVRCNKHQRKFVFLIQNTPELFWMQQTIQRYWETKAETPQWAHMANSESFKQQKKSSKAQQTVQWNFILWHNCMLHLTVHCSIFLWGMK